MIEDTLTIYDKLKADGIDDASARATAMQIGSIKEVIESFEKKLDSSDSRIEKHLNEFDRKVEKQISDLDKRVDVFSGRLDKIDKDLTWMRLIGGAMIVSFMSAIFLR